MGTTADLVVIGAGPAGTAAAITAAGAGRRVVVVDRAGFPRDKTCGDGLTTGALRGLEALGVRPDDLGASAPVHDVVLVAPSGRHIRVPLPTHGQYARVMRRTDLDAALVERAAAAGAELELGRGVTELKSQPDGVEATLADGTVVTAPFAIAADGHYSTARRLLAPHEPPVRGEWSAFRQYFTGVDDPRLWVLFERDLLPGYAWVFPLPDGRVNVGFGMLRGAGGDRTVTGKVLARTWRDLLTRPLLRDILGPRAAPESPHRAWPIPSHLDPARLAHGRVLFAGDAAGVVDPMTGEGIAQAFETGVLAAHATIDRDADPDAVVVRYRAAVDRALGRDLRLAARLQRVLAHPRGAELALRTVDLTPWTRRNFARWMFEDYPRAILLTPDRWRRDVFTRPGAYTDGGARW
jgi:geranylgeranyl reductase family protein